MRLAVLVFLVACNGRKDSDTGPVLPPDCDTTDPGGQTCSVASECHVECLCNGGSRIQAERCEGQCPSNADQCDVYCSAVGWTGVACWAHP